MGNNSPRVTRESYRKPKRLRILTSDFKVVEKKKNNLCGVTTECDTTSS